MTVQDGLCRTWSEPKLFVFKRIGSFTIFSPDDKTPGSESMITDDLSESQISLSEVSGAKYEVMDEMSSVTADIADTISSLVDENHSATEIEGLQGIMNSENIMMIPITNASDILAQGGQKLVQIVNVNGTPTLQVVNTETQLTASGRSN